MSPEAAVGYIVVSIGVIVAGWLSYRAERKSVSAERKASLAEEIARADKARSDYVGLLEKKIKVIEEDYEKMRDRIRVLETSEENCQKERISLLADIASLQRQLTKRRRGASAG